MQSRAKKLENNKRPDEFRVCKDLSNRHREGEIYVGVGCDKNRD